jgi:hypothetical protein
MVRLSFSLTLKGDCPVIWGATFGASMTVTTRLKLLLSLSPSFTVTGTAKFPEKPAEGVIVAPLTV